MIASNYAAIASNSSSKTRKFAHILIHVSSIEKGWIELLSGFEDPKDDMQPA